VSWELRLLRWRSGVTRENKLRWFGYVMRCEETKAVRVVMKINVEKKGGRGRPKMRFVIFNIDNLGASKYILALTR